MIEYSRDAGDMYTAVSDNIFPRLFVYFKVNLIIFKWNEPTPKPCSHPFVMGAGLTMQF